jgi:hypothetical protein
VDKDSLPIIYESSALIKLNSKMAAKITHPRLFEWTDTGANLSDFATGGTGSNKKVTAMMVGQQNSSTTDPYKIIMDDNQTGGDEYLWFYESSGAERIDFIGTSASMAATFTDGAQESWIWQVNGGNFEAWEEGVSIGSSTNNSAQSTSNTGVDFSVGGLGFSSRNMEGYIQEWIVWPTAESVSGIDADVDGYYSIV